MGTAHSSSWVLRACDLSSTDLMADLDCWEDASTSSEDDTSAPAPAPAPAPALAPVVPAPIAPTVPPHQCALAELPPFMLEVLSGAERAYVMDWEKTLGKFIRNTAEPSISFPPVNPELRQVLAYMAHVYRTDFMLAPFIHGTPKVACTLTRQPNSAVPVPRLTELQICHQSAAPASHWPTRQAAAPDPRLQKGTPGVKIMRRADAKSLEQRQAEELEQLERAANKRSGGAKGDKQLEYEMARARIFESAASSDKTKPQPKSQPAPPPLNQAAGPGARGFGRGAPIASQQPAQLQPRGSIGQPKEASQQQQQQQQQQQSQQQRPQGQKYGNSALAQGPGNQSRSLEDMVDPEYDRSRWQQEMPQQTQQPTYWSEFPDL